MGSSPDTFHTVLDRSGTSSYKWDYRPTNSAGRQLLPMWIADMDFPAAPVIQEALAERVEHPVYGYTFASDRYRSTFVEWQRARNGWSIGDEALLYAPGVMPAVRAAILAFSEPGDEVVVQTPVYFPFFSAIRDNGRTVLENPLVNVDGRYEMDLDRLESSISPRTRLLLLCSPHNPVGRVWTRPELERLDALCARHGLLVIADEIHSDLTRSGIDFVPYADVSSQAAARTIAAHSPSKTFNIAGIASAHLVVPNDDLRVRLESTLSRLGMTIPNALSLSATEAAYGAGGAWADSLLEFLDGQIEWFGAEMDRRFTGEILCSPIEGTYLAWLDFRRLYERTGADDAAARHALVEEAALRLSDGSRFGADGRGFFRMNLAAPRRLVEDGLERLERAVSYLEQKQ
ncbi:MAG: MalY/PatB family protein [Spirochaetota bacterium]